MSGIQLDEESIFEVASQIDSAKLRSDYLHQVCGNDTALMERVKTLLKIHDQDQSFLDKPPVDLPATLEARPITERPGDTIDNFKLLQKIGEGGFGVVYMAEQTKPVKRRVALKIIKPGMDTREVIARFEAERQALAMMNHPNIAKVLDGGETESGLPYFVMELVNGVPLTRFCDEQKLSTQARLKLFATACNAIQHAHQKGVIHRDIKPANVLVTLHDGKPVPKVIDFGISKAINQQLTEKTLFTSFGQMIGTPQYMSPEQAEMSGLNVDTRSDIYSLGVLLYELLTGTTPLEANRLREAGFAEMQRLIKEEEPPKPSTRVSGISQQVTAAAKQRGITPESLYRALRGDLDWIVMKALEKERGRRYETPSALANDIERSLRNEPVEACPPSLTYRLNKFVRRNRTAVVLGSITCMTLGLVVVATSIGLLIVGSLYHSEREMRLKADQAIQREQQARKAAESAEQQAMAEAESRRRQAYISDMNNAMEAWNEAVVGRVEMHLERHVPKNGQPDLRGPEWWYLHNLIGRSLRAPRLSMPQGVKRIAFSPNREVIAVGLANKTVSLLDAKTRRIIDEFGPANANWYWMYLAYTLDGDSILFPASEGNIITRRNLTTGEELFLEGHDRDVWSVAIFPNPKDNLLVSSGEDKVIRVWDLGNNQVVSTLEGHENSVTKVVFSSTGKLVASAGMDSTVRLWNVETGDEIARLSEGEHKFGTVTFSADESLLAAGDLDGNILVWSITSSPPKLVAKKEVHRDGVKWLEFASDGKRMFSASRDHTIKILDTDTLAEETTLKGHSSHVTCLLLDEQDTVLYSGSFDGTVRIWDLDGTGNEEIIPDTLQRSKFDFTSDGTLAFLASRRELCTWNSKTRRVTSWNEFDSITSIAVSNTDVVATATEASNYVAVRNLTAQSQSALLAGHTVAPFKVAISPNSKFAASLSVNEMIIWDLTAETQIRRISRKEFYQEDRNRTLRFSPDGRTLAVGVGTSSIELWESASAKLIRKLDGHFAVVTELAFSPDGKRLASTSWDCTVKIWDLESPLNEPVGISEQGSWVRGAAFTPDGETLIICVGDKTARFLDTTTLQQKLKIQFAHTVYWLAISPDSAMLAIQVADEGIKVLRLGKNEEGPPGTTKSKRLE